MTFDIKVQQQYTDTMTISYQQTFIDIQLLSKISKHNSQLSFLTAYFDIQP